VTPLRPSSQRRAVTDQRIARGTKWLSLDSTLLSFS
jgi:hypothetical protein